MIVCADDGLILRRIVGSVEGVIGATADGRVRRGHKLLQQLGGDRIETAGCQLNVTRGKAGVPSGPGRATCNGKWNRVGGKPDALLSAIIGDIVVPLKFPLT